MTAASLACALALLAGPSSPAASSTGSSTNGAIWINTGGVLLSAIGRGITIDVPLGVTIPFPGFATMTFEATYFRWTCVGNAACTVASEQGGVATAGFHFDTEGKGPLTGFFLSPNLQLS